MFPLRPCLPAFRPALPSQMARLDARTGWASPVRYRYCVHEKGLPSLMLCHNGTVLCTMYIPSSSSRVGQTCHWRCLLPRLAVILYRYRFVFPRGSPCGPACRQQPDRSLCPPPRPAPHDATRRHAARPSPFPSWSHPAPPQAPLAGR